MGRPRKTEEPVKERKTRTRKVEEPEVKTEQIEDPVLDEKKEDIPELVPEPEKSIDEYEVINVSSFLNVREGPGKEYKSIRKLYNGDIVPIYEIKDGWGRTDDYGWVSTDYLKKI